MKISPEQVHSIAAKARQEIQAVIGVLQAMDSAIPLLEPGLESMAQGGLLEDAHGAIQILSNTGPLSSLVGKMWTGIRQVV